jgi:hypothetical protein
VFLRIWKPVDFCRGKREALKDCFWDAICNRVSAKYVGTMKCRFPLFFSPVGSGLNSVGFGWFPLGLAGTGEPLEQLNFVLVSFSFSSMFAGASI